ncbi:uncharacterized protein LOC143291121 isoform X2 [Babylonia areolata]|uniref:uncharacterized protein LOC143291121 isoform X2 n=1 Tax=Babylonia areolata TaxID=304850 RepID=UPI003FCF4307
MADASASTMPSGQQNYVALQSQTAEETTVSTPTSSRSTTGGSEKHTEGNLSVNSHPPSDTDVPRKKTAYVESVDTSSSDEDFNRTSVSGNLQFSASVSPKVPWRRGGIWHVRSGNQRDGVHKRRSAASTGSGGRPQPEFIADTDSDTDSTESVMEFHPSLYDDDFDDMDSEFGMGAWREFLHIDNDDRERAHGPPEEPLYPQGLLVETECYVCFEETELRRRLCCDFPVCDKCLESYLMVQVLQANVNIECLNINCNSYIHRNEISARLPPKFKMKFYKFLIDANVDPTVKTCPRCSCGLQVDKAALKKRKVIKNGLHVTCKRCNLDWCFTCHAPLHKGMTCKAYRKGDVLLKEWAREFHYGQLNAQQCPKCKIFIQRSLGCDHMLCTRCSTNFCYKCGECYRGVKLLGNHFSRYSPFGCRYLFLPDAPHLRRLIRGAVLGGKLLGGLVLSGFVVVAGACMLGVSVVALPAWGGYKLHKRRRYRQRMRAKMKYTKQNLALRNLQAKKAADISVPSLPLPPPLDSSDSMADDSSDEMRDRVMVGLELPDSQRVEVLVHQTVSSSSDQEEGGGACGGGGGGGTTSTTTTTMKEVVTDSAVIVTDVQEVVNESGYTTVVTNVHAKSKDSVLHAPASAPEGADGSDEEEEYYSDDGHSHQGSRKSECRSLSSVKHAATPGKESDRQSGSDRKLAGDCDEADKLSVSVAKVIGGAGDSCCDETDKLSVSVAKVIGGGNDDAHSLKSKQHNKTADRKDRDTGSTQEKKGEDKEPSTVKEKKEKKGEDKEPSTVKEKKAEDKEPSTVKEKKEKKAEDKEPSTVKEKKEKKG